MVNLELYRVFYVVAKCGSLTRAAEELFISQPAVSQSIKQLETQLGGKLFLRTSKGMELTEKEGKMMFSHVQKIIEISAAAENEFNELKKKAAGVLRISASDTLCKYFLMDYIEEFHKHHPQIIINVYNRTSSETVELLKTGKADVGFVNLPVDDASVDVVLPCEVLHHIFVAGRKFSHLTGRTVPLKELEQYPLIMLELSSNTRKHLVSFFHSVGVHLHPEIELGSVDLLKGFARANMGITCVAKEYVLRNLEDGSLLEIETDPPAPILSTGMITLKKAPLTYAVKEFINCIKGKGVASPLS
ncbi:MAG: LysR family transcriptional regulator [Christensenellales bacterium]